MKLAYKIDGIFPTPIYITKINRKLSKIENKFIKESASNVNNNQGNLISKDTYVLDKPPFKKLKIELLAHLKEYYKVVCKFDKVEPYLTQSWLNFTSENQYHHQHEHPNSMISGVFYINSEVNNDSIKFWNHTYKRIRPQISEWTWLNSESWTYPVESNDLIIFPSQVTHSVQVKKGNNLRISLAFNSFIKGEIGTEDKIDLLHI